jgi:hypothetical protein
VEEPEFALKALLILTNAGLGFALVGWVFAKQLKLRNGTGDTATGAGDSSSLAVLTQVSLSLQSMENRIVNAQDRNHEELRLYFQAAERVDAERHSVILNEVRSRKRA